MSIGTRRLVIWLGMIVVSIPVFNSLYQQGVPIGTLLMVALWGAALCGVVFVTTLPAGRNQ